MLVDTLRERKIYRTKRKYDKWCNLIEKRNIKKIRMLTKCLKFVSVRENPYSWKLDIVGNSTKPWSARDAYG